MTSIKGLNSLANLQKMTLKNPTINLVNDNVYTKFSLNLTDIEQIPNSEVKQGS